MIKYIVIDEPTVLEFNLPTYDRIIGKLGHINVFSGKNNSGKSRLLRTIFKDASAKRNTTDNSLSFLNESPSTVLEDIEASIRAIADNYYISWSDKPAVNDFVVDFVDLALKNEETSIHFIRNMHELNEQSEFFKKNNEILQRKGVTHFFINQQKTLLKKMASMDKKKPYPSLYIPILRGLRPINYSNGFTNDDVFEKRTIFDYFERKSELKIFTGLSMYDDIRKLLLGTEEDRKLIADFEDFLTKHIFNEKVTLIPKHDMDVLHIKIGKNRQREVFNLGDGLQTIITILFPVFIRKDEEHLIFIEEPEAHLHPMWQVKLLNAIKDIPNQQYFITTHSTAFINDADVTLFAVQQQENEMRINDAKLEDKKLKVIRDLGYKQSDLLQANYILWVEGYSDKIYLEYWISQLKPDWKEGIHYSILFFGGSNYKHLLSLEMKSMDLSFVKTINRSLGIVLDSDKSKSSEKLKKDKQLIKDHFEESELFCWITDSREIENYLDHDTFVRAVQQVYPSKEVVVSEGNYDDWNTVTDTKAAKEFGAKIKLPESIFSQIQKNKNGIIPDKVTDADLRKAVQDAIQETGKNTFSIDKIMVAKKYVFLNPPQPQNELLDKLNELIEKISKANTNEIE